MYQNIDLLPDITDNRN